MDEDFLSWTGVSATPAVVLCQSLTIHNARGDQGGQPMETLYASGTTTVPVIECWDGWAKVYYADGAKTGWVRSDYLMLAPAWYVCDQITQVYAYPDAMAPRVALLDTGDTLPILTEYDDGESVSGWVCVALRGAAGWILKTPQDTAGSTWFRPDMLQSISSAVLTYGGESISTSRRSSMTALAALLTSANDLGAEMSGCPFGATLTLYLADGSAIELTLASDSCCVYRVDGRDYQYARNLADPYEGSPDNSVLLEIFGLNTWDDLFLPGNG